MMPPRRATQEEKCFSEVRLDSIPGLRGAGDENVARTSSLPLTLSAIHFKNSLVAFKKKKTHNMVNKRQAF